MRESILQEGELSPKKKKAPQKSDSESKEKPKKSSAPKKSDGEFKENTKKSKSISMKSQSKKVEQSSAVHGGQQILRELPVFNTNFPPKQTQRENEDHAQQRNGPPVIQQNQTGSSEYHSQQASRHHLSSQNIMNNALSIQPRHYPIPSEPSHQLVPHTPPQLTESPLLAQDTIMYPQESTLSDTAVSFRAALNVAHNVTALMDNNDDDDDDDYPADITDYCDDPPIVNVEKNTNDNQAPVSEMFDPYQRIRELEEENNKLQKQLADLKQQSSRIQHPGKDHKINMFMLLCYCYQSSY